MTFNPTLTPPPLHFFLCFFKHHLKIALEKHYPARFDTDNSIVHTNPHTTVTRLQSITMAETHHFHAHKLFSMKDHVCVVTGKPSPSILNQA